MVELNSVVAETAIAARTEALTFIELDRTDCAIKMRLLVDQDIFIQIYANECNDKLNMALVMQNKRIYGFDREGGFYHLHPFLAPHQHLPTDSPKTISAFVREALELLVDFGLL